MVKSNEKCLISFYVLIMTVWLLRDDKICGEFYQKISEKLQKEGNGGLVYQMSKK